MMDSDFNDDNEVTFRFHNGDEVKDLVTGYVGIIDARIEYLNGCKQYSVVAKSEDNKIKKGWWIDEEQLELQTAMAVNTKFKRLPVRYYGGGGGETKESDTYKESE